LNIYFILRKLAAIAIRQAEQVVPGFDRAIEFAAAGSHQGNSDMGQPVISAMADIELVAVVFGVNDQALAATVRFLKVVGDKKAVVHAPAVFRVDRDQRREIDRLQHGVEFARGEARRGQ
jgi:hypothetical protein